MFLCSSSHEGSSYYNSILIYAINGLKYISMKKAFWVAMKSLKQAGLVKNVERFRFDEKIAD